MGGSRSADRPASDATSRLVAPVEENRPATAPSTIASALAPAPCEHPDRRALALLGVPGQPRHPARPEGDRPPVVAPAPGVRNKLRAVAGVKFRKIKKSSKS